MTDLERSYLQWRESYPWVYERVRQLAEERLRSNRKFGMQALVERVRWDIPLDTPKYKGYRINNNLVAYLARELKRDLPGLERLMETRSVRGEQRIA